SDYESGKPVLDVPFDVPDVEGHVEDRKSTRLNSSHVSSSYAVICSKKKRLGFCCVSNLGAYCTGWKHSFFFSPPRLFAADSRNQQPHYTFLSSLCPSHPAVVLYRTS